MKLNLKATASAFALTALIAFGTAASLATNPGRTANNVNNVTPPADSNAQSIASAPLPQDLTVTPNLKMDVYAGALPGGAQAIHAVFITTEKKKVDVPLLSASLTTANINANFNANNAANLEATAAPAPDIAPATTNLNAATAEAANATVHSIALTPKTEIAMAATRDATTDAANNATATALTPTNEVALASNNAPTNAATNEANIGKSNALTATTGAGNANTRSELAGLNPDNRATAANINQSDHVSSLYLSASLKSEDTTIGNTGNTFTNTAGSSVIS
jgi:hypothetical protein